MIFFWRAVVVLCFYFNENVHQVWLSLTRPNLYTWNPKFFFGQVVGYNIFIIIFDFLRTPDGYNIFIIILDFLTISQNSYGFRRLIRIPMNSQEFLEFLS